MEGYTDVLVEGWGWIDFNSLLFFYAHYCKGGIY